MRGLTRAVLEWSLGRPSNERQRRRGEPQAGRGARPPPPAGRGRSRDCTPLVHDELLGHALVLDDGER
ncbi:MAG: hypothetical protein H0T39_14865 [Actinobacteria bacterium]|nr:hypothetical protein [Actinomycetota bacterium]